MGPLIFVTAKRPHTSVSTDDFDDAAEVSKEKPPKNHCSRTVRWKRLEPDVHVLFLTSVRKMTSTRLYWKLGWKWKTVRIGNMTRRGHFIFSRDYWRTLDKWWRWEMLKEVLRV